MPIFSMTTRTRKTPSSKATRPSRSASASSSRASCGSASTATGDGPDFDLSDVVPEDVKKQLKWCDWEGCETTCIDRTVTVPANTIPAGYCGTLYQVGAKFELHCCGECECGDRSTLAVAGHESQGEYMFV